MYACICESSGRFLQGCALTIITHSFLATHPHLLAIREVALKDTPWLPHRSEFM